MFLSPDRYCKLGQIADIIGLRPGIYYDLPSWILGVRRSIISPEYITVRVTEEIPVSLWGILSRDCVPLSYDYVKFLLDSGIFFADIHEKRGHRMPLHILKSDLSRFDIPVIDISLQSLLSNLELAWEWAVKERQYSFRYADLRAAMFDEIRHLVAIELYFPYRMHSLNIYAVDALLEIEELLERPDELFDYLTFGQSEIMNQIKRFRSMVF